MPSASLSPCRSRLAICVDDLELDPVMVRIRVLLADAHRARLRDPRPERGRVDLVPGPRVEDLVRQRRGLDPAGLGHRGGVAWPPACRHSGRHIRARSARGTTARDVDMRAMLAPVRESRAREPAVPHRRASRDRRRAAHAPTKTSWSTRSRRTHRSGTGDHVFIRIEKRGLTTPFAVGAASRARSTSRRATSASPA